MRMRKKKHGEERLSACRELILPTPESPLSDPGAALGMSGAPVFLEIGAGKGGFACEMSARHKDSAYFAMERVSDCVVLAAEKAKETADARMGNLRFIIDTADNLLKIFSECSVDKVFLNFSDPWSKKGYAKRRLTHRRYLAVYFALLKDGGTVTFKTDNVGLFDFTLEELSDIGIKPDFVTRDLHASPRAESNVMTEYEKNFSDLGMKINMVEFRKPRGFSLPIPEDMISRERYYTKERE